MVRTKEKPRQSRETRIKQAKLEAEQSTLLAAQLGYPTPTGYTFTDEMWRTRTVQPLRCYSRESDNGPLRPSWPAPLSDGMAPRTIAQRAHEEDLALWASSASIEEYEERRRARDEQRRSEREAFMRGQPVFHRFLSLPAELRLMIWKMALEEPTRVILFILTRTMPSRQSGGWCGTTFPISWEHVATATLPPLMLVNCESHRVASRHYQRAFRGLHARGGVLAAYPTVLTVKGDAFTPMQTDGLRFVRDFVLEYETYSQTSTGIDDKFRPAVLQAPDLQTFTVLTRRQDPAAAPSILSRLRRLFRELTEAHPHLNVPTIELCFGNGVEDAPEWICCFRGSPLMLLET